MQGYGFSFQRRWVYVASKTSLPRLRTGAFVYCSTASLTATPPTVDAGNCRCVARDPLAAALLMSDVCVETLIDQFATVIASVSLCLEHRVLIPSVLPWP